MKLTIPSPWSKYSRYIPVASCLCIVMLITPTAIREMSLHCQVATLIQRITNPPPGQNMHRANEHLAFKIIDAGGGNKLLNYFPNIIDSSNRVAKTHVYEILVCLRLTNPAIRNSLLKIANDKSKDPNDRKDAIYVLRHIDPMIDDFCSSVEELKSQE